MLIPTETRIAYDTNRVSIKGLKKAITKTGYEAKLAKP